MLTKIKKYQLALIGSSGFVAEALIKRALKEKKSVLYFGRNKPSAVSADDFVPYDLKVMERLPNRFEIDTVIFNSVIKGRFRRNSEEWTQQGQVSAPDFSDLFDRLGLEVSRLVTIGSSEEYGPRTDSTLIFEDGPLTPISSYGDWKVRLYEENLKWSKFFNRPAIHLRPFNIFGPGLDRNMFLGALIHQLLENKSFPMTAGEQHRSFVPVRILVETIFKLIELKSWGPYQKLNALNISSHHYYRICDVALMILEIIQKGKLEIGKLPYRQEEVWHQNPDLSVLDQLLGDAMDYDFKNEIEELIRQF